MSSPHLIRRDQAVLSLVDIQEKLAAVMARRDSVVSNARKLILAAARLEVPVLVTEQYPKGLGPTVPELVDVLGQSCVRVVKLTFACTGASDYTDCLQRLGRSQVLLCGMETHVCVLQTCLDLLDRGLKVFVAADAVCSRREEDRDVALAQMRQAGAEVTTTEAVVFQLLERAGTAEFKDLLSIIK